ncbi:MAG TPA: DoxX family protein [Streptosporangiaceae bacterium]|nr:DoxX family protein [Streptosporangiaceae bacterium]
MTILRTLARPMLASIFIVMGYQTMRSPERLVKQAEPVVGPLAEFVPFVPEDTEQAVRLNGAAQLAGGALLAVGWLPRLAALTIAATLIPTTIAGHRFWDIDDPQERAQQRVQFLKNLSMLGGLLMAATSGNSRGGRGLRR